MLGQKIKQMKGIEKMKQIEQKELTQLKNQTQQMKHLKQKLLLKKRLSIEGTITVMRKSRWVTRYASIKECIFSYRKNDKRGQKDRWIVDLRQCEVNWSNEDKFNKFIQIIGPDKTKVDIEFKTVEE